MKYEFKNVIVEAWIRKGEFVRTVSTADISTAIDTTHKIEGGTGDIYKAFDITDEHQRYKDNSEMFYARRLSEGVSFNDWTDVEHELPAPGDEVLIRGWGEGRKHYVFSFGYYNVDTAIKEWRNSSLDFNERLWFEPVAWARIPVPEEGMVQEESE